MTYSRQRFGRRPKSVVGNSFWLAGHIGNKIGYVDHFKWQMYLFDLTFLKKQSIFYKEVF